MKRKTQSVSASPTMNCLADAKPSQRSIYDVPLSEFIVIYEANSEPELVAQFFDDLQVNNIDETLKAIESRDKKINRCKSLYNEYTIRNEIVKYLEDIADKYPGVTADDVYVSLLTKAKTGADSIASLIEADGIPIAKFSARIKNEEVQLKLLQGQVQAKEGAAIDKKWFAQRCKDFSDMTKRNITISDLSAGTFTDYYKDLYEYSEMLKNNGR